MKNIHILNGHGQGGAPDPHGPPVIDAAVLEAELAVGETCFVQVPLSQSHLYALASAAQVVAARRDCPEYTRLLLRDFLKWCVNGANFGPETRKMLALEFAQTLEVPRVINLQSTNNKTNHANKTNPQ
jgi:hypothetical protein